MTLVREEISKLDDFNVKLSNSLMSICLFACLLNDFLLRTKLKKKKVI